MKVKEVGIVIAVNDNIAKVKASRHNDCDNCGACPGSSAIVIDADNTLGAVPGQRVHFVVEQVNMLLAAFIVYIFPLLFTALVVMGTYHMVVLYNFVNLTVWMIVSGLLAFVCAIFIIRAYERWAKQKTDKLPTIIEIV